MSTSTDTQPSIEHIFDEPDLDLIRTELEQCLRDSSVFAAQYERDHLTRFCLWKGQSADARKWHKRHGGAGKAKPWDGASDVRPFVTDEIIIDQVDTMMLAWQRSTVQVTALNTTKLDWSTRVSRFASWQLKD